MDFNATDDEDSPDEDESDKDGDFGRLLTEGPCNFIPVCQLTMRRRRVWKGSKSSEVIYVDRFGQDILRG